MTSLEVSVLIIAIVSIISLVCFSIFIFFAVKLLLTLNRTIQDSRKSLSEKINCFDSTLRSISNVGDIFECKTQAYKERQILECLKEKIDSESSKKSKLEDILKICESTINLLKK